MSYRTTSKRMGQRKRRKNFTHAETHNDPILLQNFGEHWLITIRIGPNGKGTPEPSQTFLASLHSAVERGTNWGRKSFMCFTFTCLPSNPRAEIQLGVGWGQNLLLHRGCITDGEKPTWSFRQPLSQLAVKTGKEKKPTADTLCPVLFLTIEFLAEGRSLEKNVICSCIPEVTEKLKDKMKSSKALGPHFNSNFTKIANQFRSSGTKSIRMTEYFFFSIKLQHPIPQVLFFCIIRLSLFLISCKHFYLKSHSRITKATLFPLYFWDYFWFIIGPYFVFQTHQIYIC